MCYTDQRITLCVRLSYWSGFLYLVSQETLVRAHVVAVVRLSGSKKAVR